MHRQGLEIRLVHWTLLTQGVLAVALFAWEAVNGPGTFTVLSGMVAGLDLNLSFKVDALSTVLFAMISVLGAVISQYSLRYLDGEERQGYFYKNLLFTVSAVSLLVLSSNLIMFFIAWCLSSIGLHRLLLFYPQRPLAVAAARKKFLISRLGDLFLLAGFVICYNVFKSFEFERIFALAADQAFASANGSMIASAGVFLALGAIAKSAQFPLHFWLPETMETPTPVSALMHAGIINAGGFLIIRLSPLLTHVELPHLLLTLAGAVTAVYGALVMITQNDIKKKLAYSTISQMGLMIFACGLGAYSIALFHIIAHSFYKAYAFLSTGDLVGESKKSSLQLAPFGAWYSALATVVGLTVLGYGVVYQDGTHFSYFAYAGLLIIALMQCVVVLPKSEFSRLKYFTSIASMMFLAVAIYTGIEFYVGTRMQSIVADTLDVVTISSPIFAVSAISLVIFGIGFHLAGRLYRPNDVFSKRLYVSLWNGNYFTQKSSKVLSAVWPVNS
ncbi:MAG: proton-conducting transporter membrane subunit [bacterium]